MFQITAGRGFHVTFANGYTVSVQFGAGNYCANRDYALDNVEARDRELGSLGCPNAEVAAWGPGDKWVRLAESDDVIGWQTPDQVLAIMVRIAALPKL